MTKKEIIKQVANNLQLSQHEVHRILEETLGVIGDALDRKETVTIKDFGTFTIKHFKERPGRNVATGEPIVIPERDSIRFRPHEKICFYSRKV